VHRAHHSSRWTPLPADEREAAPDKCFAIFDSSTGKKIHFFAAEKKDTSGTKKRLCVSNSPHAILDVAVKIALLTLHNHIDNI
jgi:hypothetical protein